jgi:hypothetical protein
MGKLILKPDFDIKGRDGPTARGKHMQCNGAINTAGNKYRCF